MDGEELLGYLLALAWLGMFVYLAASDIRRAGSFAAWARELMRNPLESFGSILIWAGCTAFLLWLLTGGAVSVKLALMAPVGIVMLLAFHRFRRSP
jgi:hypothetical protein